MNSLFDQTTQEEINKRIEKLSPDSKAAWGKMNVAQMLTHCQFPLKVALKKDHPPMKPNWIVQLFFKKSMYNDSVWKKNMPTLSDFKVETPKEFTQEKEKLKRLLNEYYTYNNTAIGKHPMFGKLTNDQWGKMQYKHLNHHLQQFEV